MTDKTKKKPGGQPGNTNSCGNVSGGTPKGAVRGSYNQVKGKPQDLPEKFKQEGIDPSLELVKLYNSIEDDKEKINFFRQFQNVMFSKPASTDEAKKAMPAQIVFNVAGSVDPKQEKQVNDIIPELPQKDASDE